MKKTILLVEDEAIIAMSEAKTLKKHGFEVITVYNGEKAIEAVQHHTIDLILMDIDLGQEEMDGTQAAQVILQDHDIPVVFLSSHTEPEVVEKTEKITAYGYVVKNTGETVLINSINMAFKLYDSFQKEKEHEQLMSAMIAASPVAIHGIDPQGNIMIWNESSEKMFGWSTDEVLGKPLPIVPEDKLEDHSKIRRRVLSGETVYRQEVIRQKKNGTRFYGMLSTSPLYDNKGDIFGIVAIMEDITERKKVEHALKQHQQYLRIERDRFHALIETSPIPIVFVDRTGTLTYANKQAESTLEIKKSGSDSRTYNDPKWAITDFDGNPFPDGELPFAIVSTTHQPVYDVKHTITTKSGKCRYLSINGTPLFDEKGEFDGMIAVLRDVTEQKHYEDQLKQKEKNLQEGEQKIRNIIDSLNDGIVVIDKEYNLVRTNQKLRDDVNIENEEKILQRKCYSVFYGFESPCEWCPSKAVLATGKNQSTVVPFPVDNPQYWFHLEASPIRNMKGELTHIVESARDITERKALEEELEKDRYRLTAILEGTNVGTWEWNIQTGETHFNERWAQIIGYTLDELDPISIETWKQYTHPDDFKESERLLDKHFRGELDHYEAECRMRQKNGTWVWVLDRGKVATWTEDGEPEWMYGTHQDITERREAEQLREDINRIIQHDLKNPLNGIMGMIQLLREDESLSEEGREYVAFIEESGKQMRLLIDTSLSLYKMEQGTYTFDPEEVALDDLFDLITQEFKQATERKDLDIRFDYDSKHSPTSQKYIVRGKYFLCYSLFSNLIKNAIEASRNNDIIRISIREDKPSWITTAIWNRQEIPREIRKRFGHKYATAGKKRGTGLGVYSAVLMTEIQGGRFNWRSSQEEGTEITVTLPRAQ